MRKWIIIFLFVTTLPLHTYADFVFRSKTNLTISLNSKEAEVVHTALAIFEKDYKNVFGGSIVRKSNAQIIIATLGNNSHAEKLVNKKSLQELGLHKEGFLIEVRADKIYILGSDKRGTAYGILELSRLIGVSPWEWWADSHSPKKASFTLKNGYTNFQYPSVAYRGIFINDEDWGLLPWASKNFEPGLPKVGKTKGAIGPKTYSKVFELLLRLRANTIWPTMHEVSVPFYLTKGNKEVADKYGIIISTSHCEPLMRNSATEWDLAGKGDYNYVTNKNAILDYWTERVNELKGSDNIYTIGLRGKHDGVMQGVKTLKEHKTVLIEVLKDQRELLKKHANSDVTKVPQVFIPYKEVLDVYNNGLDVPEDVMLMWTDDNYGYIRHFPTEKERARKGGNGIYYHVSYWGRPHDYLWLSTIHPALLYTQMKTAYDKGAQEMWILNVGDIKPSEYLTELFLDMAWNINSIKNNEQGLNEHLEKWLVREFGKTRAVDLVKIMNEYYRLAYIRKPEFMGNTRTEERDSIYKQVKDLPWSEEELKVRLKQYTALSTLVNELSKSIDADKKDSWFQLVEYPLKAAAEMNKKHIYAQLARHGKADWAKSDEAYQSIINLTETYNSLAGGKWKYMMDYKPRDLAVFDKVPRINATAPLIQKEKPLHLFNGSEYKKFNGMKPIMHGLGYERKAISLQKNSSVVYNFQTTSTDSVWIELAFVPNLPVDGKTIRYGISLNGSPMKIVDYKTEGRSEEWKENVLNNQAIRITAHPLLKNGIQELKITAIDEGVMIDQIKIWNKSKKTRY